MSDHPPVRDLPLDDRIRRLVARAVADAPIAPDLALVPALEQVTPRPDRRPWWIVGTSLLGAAATAVALILVNTNEQTIAPVATQPEIVGPVPTAASTTTAPVALVQADDATELAGSVATWAPSVATVPVPVPVPTDGGPGPTTSDPAVTPPATAMSAALAVADGSSVALLDGAGQPIGSIDQPWSIALAVGDGRVVGQERTGAGFGRWATVATTPRIWDPDGTVRELFPVVGERAIALHDVAVVSGTPWLLYSVHNGDPTPDGQREDLHAVSLDGRAEVLTVGQIGAWEAGTQRLHLAANGLIVGESFSEAFSSLLVLALPGSPAATWADALTRPALGLDDSYGDCDDCPHAYTVDDRGETVAWVDQGNLVTVPIHDGVVGDRTRDPFGTDPLLVSDLDLDPTSDGRYVVSFFQADGVTPRPALLVMPGGESVTLAGTVAAWGPAGGEATGPEVTST